MAVSDAAKRATAKYKRSHYDTIQILVKSGGRELVKAHAARHDSSTNAFIIRAIRQALEDDGADSETIRAICGDTSGSSGR